MEQEVDLGYCRAHGIPVFRREAGGGAVYLDGEQLFYQLVIHRDSANDRKISGNGVAEIGDFIRVHQKLERGVRIVPIG